MTQPRVQSLARAAIAVAGVTVLARVVGFGRVLVFAHTVGPSCLGDAYYTANTIPNILFDVVAGGALSTVAVPLLAGPVDAGDGDTADRTTSALLTWTLLVLLPVLAVTVLLAGPIVHLLVGNGHPGCSAAAERAVGARMLRVFAPQLLLYGAVVVLTGVLQAHRRFVAAAVAPLLSSVVVIGAYVAFAIAADRSETGLVGLTRDHELLLSVGTTLGVVALLLPLIFPLRRTGRRLRPTLRFPPGAAATARRLAIAGAVTLGSQDLATAGILRLANDRGATGAVVLYTLAWTVFLVPWAVLAVPLATTAFPTMVARWEAGDTARYAATAASTSRAVVLATAGAAAVLVAAALPVARVVILGAPGSAAPAELARALATFAPGLVGYGLVAHLARVHVARGDPRTPAIATGLGWLLVVLADIGLVIALPRHWTAAALGIGTTVGMTAAAAGLVVALGRRAGVAALDGLARTTVSSITSAVLAAGLGALLAHALPAAGAVVSTAVSVGVGGLCLVLFVAVIRVLDPGTLRLVLRGRAVALVPGLGRDG
ncbi:MAG: putative peptidoglycan lipid flippase [Frankiaceae bacterium]|jgi:putative peptidoglycan lipid II flippase|nr:putative peptidoglycan lipid flippase [Frankiaceae bacterium]